VYCESIKCVVWVLYHKCNNPVEASKTNTMVDKPMGADLAPAFFAEEVDCCVAWAVASVASDLTDLVVTNVRESVVGSSASPPAGGMDLFGF